MTKKEKAIEAIKKDDTVVIDGYLFGMEGGEWENPYCKKYDSGEYVQRLHEPYNPFPGRLISTRENARDIFEGIDFRKKMKIIS